MAIPDPAAEQALVEQAKRDPEAFGRIYDLYFQRIYSYIFRKVGDRTTAEDLTSDTFFKALSHIQGYRFTGQPFAAWLFRIAANVVNDHYRSRRPLQGLDEGAPLAALDEGPEEAALRLDSRDAVSRLVAQLTPEQQDVIMLRFSGDLPLKEIAQMVGKTEGAVKALMFRALHSLKDKLEESGVRA